MALEQTTVTNPVEDTSLRNQERGSVTKRRRSSPVPYTTSRCDITNCSPWVAKWFIQYSEAKDRIQKTAEVTWVLASNSMDFGRHQRRRIIRQPFFKIPVVDGMFHGEDTQLITRGERAISSQIEITVAISMTSVYWYSLAISITNKLRWGRENGSIDPRQNSGLR